MTNANYREALKTMEEANDPNIGAVKQAVLLARAQVQATLALTTAVESIASYLAVS